MADSNPFASLIQNNRPQRAQASIDPNELNSIYESIFLITLNQNHDSVDKPLLFLDGSESNQLDISNLDEVLLQRVMLNDKESIEELIKPAIKNSKSVYLIETNQFVYLYKCFTRLNKFKQKLTEYKLYEKTLNLIINMSRTLLNIFDQEQNESLILSQKFLYLIESNLKSCQNLSEIETFYELFIKQFDETSLSRDFFANTTDQNDYLNLSKLIEDPSELKFLNDLFFYLNKNVINLNECEEYSNQFVYFIDLIKFITRSKLMKFLLIANSFVQSSSLGRNWQTMTIIGKLLTANCLPLNQFKLQGNSFLSEPVHQFRYFTNPNHMTRQDIEINEKNMSQAQSLIRKELNSLFYEHLIRVNSNNKIRNLWLKWVSQVMEDNKAKAQEWSNYGQNPMSMLFGNQNDNYVSDGFFFNLLDLFLTYSQPFCCETLSNSSKLLKINFNYTNSLFSNKSFKQLDKETKLIPTKFSDPAIDLESNNNFNFITECFYLTNNLIKLAYLSIYQKIMKLNNELSRWQSTYQQLMQSGSSDQQMSRIKSMFENMTIEFLNLKTYLTENDLIKKMSKFLFNSSAWLYYLGSKADLEDFKTDTSLVKPLEPNDLEKIDTNKFNLKLLSLIPEFFITNIVEFVIFINRFKEALIPDLFVSVNSEIETHYLSSFLSLVLVYMGRADRLFNPHIRASLAEALEALLPKKNSSHSFDYLSRKNLAIKIFSMHSCSSFISESLLNVFVSIEMTGQSVQFEQKFNYRRPMYELIDYLWNMQNQNSESDIQNKTDLLCQHQTKLKQLAKYAFDHIEDVEQPLFLKFLNYLINDANFLLLEGLLYLEKIKLIQDQLAQNEIDKNLSNQQRAEMESNLKHMTMLAKFHNFMSLKTIQTIKMFTVKIKQIFCHDVIVDRIATMLNDFLLHLVGKKKRKQLKVKNFDEVEFKPKEVVSIICDIYLNLSENRKFCEAVCRDGRSYSSDLFQLGIQVLEQINKDYLEIEKFKNFSIHVEEIAQQQRMDESNFDDAPDEYLDPIMSSLMVDPVILPNSKQIVDRSTIARHLLSDQTDPFNRSPLTLQEVIPATDLKNEIEQWKISKRGK